MRIEAEPIYVDSRVRRTALARVDGVLGGLHSLHDQNQFVGGHRRHDQQDDG